MCVTTRPRSRHPRPRTTRSLGVTHPGTPRFGNGLEFLKSARGPVLANRPRGGMTMPRLACLRLLTIGSLVLAGVAGCGGDKEPEPTQTGTIPEQLESLEVAPTV